MIKSCVSCHRRGRADWAPAVVDRCLQLVDCIDGNWVVSARSPVVLQYLRSPVVMLYLPSGDLNIDLHVIVETLESKSSPSTLRCVSMWL